MARHWSLLALVVVLLVAVGTWLWSGDGSGALLAPDAEPATRAAAGSRAATAQAGPADGVRVAVPAPASAPASGTAPILADAPEYEVLVLAKDSGQPVPGADVWWTDGTTWERIPRVPAIRQGSQAADQERTARAYGWHTRSDQRGRARVRGQHGVSVHGRSGTRYGTTLLQEGQPAPPGGWRLLLQEDRTLRVRVLDSNGVPACDVRLAVVRRAADDTVRPWQGAPMPATEEPDGIARFVHLQDWRLDQDPKQPGGEWRVRTAVPGHEDNGVAFDPTAPPAEPLVLRLPACGSVVVRALFQGKPVPVDAGAPPRVTLLEQGGDRRSELQGVLQRTLPFEDGAARFPGVPVGSNLVVQFLALGARCEQPIAGPAAAGEEVAVTMSLSEDIVAIAGRLLDPVRQPLRQVRALVEMQGSQFVSGGVALCTDGEGRFLHILGNARENSRIERFLVQHQERGGPRLRAELPPRGVTPGVNDLGDLVLDRGPLLVAGRFLSGETPWTRTVRFTVERLEAPGGRGPADRWRPAEAVTQTQESDGLFDVRGPAQPGRYLLVFQGSGFVPIAPIEFTPGTSELVVQVTAGHALDATLLVPPQLPEGLDAVLVREAPALPGPDPRTAHMTEHGPGQLAATWAAVAPGTYGVEVRAWGTSAPLVTIRGITVPSTPPDPRLNDIDLRGRVTTLGVRVVDASDPGRKLVRRAVVFVQPLDDHQSDWQGVSAWDGSVRFPVPMTPVDLLVCAQGMQPAPVQDARGEVTVELRPWPEVEVVFPDLPELPADLRLLAGISRRLSPQRHLARGGMSGSSLDPLLHPRTEPYPVVAGRVRLPVGDQACRVALLVRSGNNRMANVSGVQLPEIKAGSGPITVLVPAEAIQKAIAELRAR